MAPAVTKYVRYAVGAEPSYGVLEGKTIHQLTAAPFAGGKPTRTAVELKSVKLLAPCEPSKVVAVGLNYRSHLRDRPVPEYPGLFTKFSTSIVGPEAEIVIPADAADVHYEGELVAVIGKTTRNVAPEDASDHVFGVTAGNDVSERRWQRSDLQWFRAKGSDTFGPLGPAIVSGLDYGDLLIQTRLNGEVRQSESSKDLLFDVDTIVSYVSRYVTLQAGDVIFTGTPGSTRAMRPGDVVEVEIENVGVLRNTVVQA